MDRIVTLAELTSRVNGLVCLTQKEIEGLQKEGRLDGPKITGLLITPKSILERILPPYFRAKRRAERELIKRVEKYGCNAFAVRHNPQERLELLIYGKTQSPVFDFYVLTPEAKATA